MTTPRYRLGRQFVLRMTGFPVDALVALRAPALTAACDAALDAASTLEARAAELSATLLEHRGCPRGWQRHIARREPLPAAAQLGDATPFPSDLIAGYEAARAAAAERRAAVAPIYDAALDHARAGLYAFARDERVRHVFLLSSATLTSIAPPAADEPLPPRRKRLRERDATWSAYLQRLTTKNETISFFGPSVWGQVERDAPAAIEIELDDTELDRRVAYWERGICEQLAAALAADAGVAAVAMPVTPTPFDELRRRVAELPEPASTRWTQRLAELDEQRLAFEREPTGAGRAPILAAIDALLAAWSIGTRRGTQSLYSARMPLNEDCRRAARRVTVGRPLVEQVEHDLVPWLELWRDLAGLFATRLHEAVAPICRALGPQPTLAAVLTALDEREIPLGKSGGQGAMLELDAEIQAAWQEQLGDRAAQSEVQLTDDDFGFLRRRFVFRRMRDGDLPAPDLQILAPDAAAAKAGRGLVVLGEIHPDFVHWQHAISVFCPEPAELAAEYRAHHAPALLFGRHLAELSAHTSLPRGQMGGWSGVRPFAPADVPSFDASEITVELTDDDLVARAPDGRVLGSLLHTWNVALNTHGLELLGTGEHAPRLRAGRVVVQRESWIVTPDDRTRAATEADSATMALAIQELRRAHRLPREVFVRALLVHRITLHKDAKPFFVDFDNPLLVELLAATVRRAFQLRVTEALPRLEDCWLADARGRYSFELRAIAYPDGR